MKSAWVVRSSGGKRYDDFRDLNAVGIGWPEMKLWFSMRPHGE